MIGKVCKVKLLELMQFCGVSESFVEFLECQALNRESPVSNSLYYPFEGWAFSFSPRRPRSIAAI